jgi:hypothetical protein
VAATLRVVEGVARRDEAALARVLSAPGRAVRSREGEHLSLLFSPAGGGDAQLWREVAGLVARTYWATPGSVTAALRKSISTANRYLFEHNLNTRRCDRCYGGLMCAVLRDRDLFLLAAGPVWACVLQGEDLRCFPRGEKLAHLGIGPVPDVRLHHVFASPGDTLLLAPHTLLRAAGEEGVRRALSMNDVDAAAESLVQIGSEDFAALVVRWESAAESDPLPTPGPVKIRRQESSAPAPPQEVEAAAGRQPPETPPARERRRPERRMADRGPRRRQPGSERGAQIKETLGKVGLVLGAILGTLGNYLGGALTVLWHGVAAVGAGLLALGRWLLGLVVITIRSTLPGTGRAARSKGLRHPPPDENRRVMAAIAVAIPVVILALVLLAHRQFATRSQFRGYVNRAKEQIALAQAAGRDTDEARVHWEAALEEIEAAATLEPEHPVAHVLRDQTRDALDELEGIHRLALTELGDFGSSNVERRMVLTGQTLFVLDAAEGWVAGLPIRSEDGEPAIIGGPGETLVRTGQQVDGEELGELVDCVWVEAEGGRQTSTLLVLDENNRLVAYDPAWRGEGGSPQLSLVELGSPPAGTPIAVGTYEGQFYILDGTAGGGGQIWRYKPQGDGYPAQPEGYFPADAPQHLGQATDMGIDGYIYLLYPDGRVDKFLGGEEQTFEARGIPGSLGEVAGFAVDPQGDGSVYLADRDNNRVIVLDEEGRFQAQLRGDPPLESLEALAISQSRGRLWVLAGGKVYRAILP